MTIDPDLFEWMWGFPPPPERRVGFGDGTYSRYPQTRWSYSHLEQLVPTKAAWRGPSAASALSSGENLAMSAPVETLDGRSLSLGDALLEQDTDAVAVVHRGRLVHEAYFGRCGPHTRHTVMSCNKSMVGTLAECLIDEGTLDDRAVVPTILPELAGTAWDQATVRHVLDMVVDMEFHEDYMDPESDVYRFLRSTGLIPAAPGDVEAVSEYLPTITGSQQHGRSFAYREPNIFVLGWIVRRAANTDVATLASERIWQHVGAEHDWLYMVDPSGAESTALVTLRDFARFGWLVCNGGMVGDRRVLPERVVDAIHGGGDIDVFAAGDRDVAGTFSYRSQWWYRHVDNRVCPVARGAQGQLLYIDPDNELVIVRYASPPMHPPLQFDNLWWPIVDTITATLT